MKRLSLRTLLVLASNLALLTAVWAGGSRASSLRHMTPGRVSAHMPMDSACSSVPRPGNSTGSLLSDGIRRTYLLHVPRHLPRGRHLPLVLVFHQYREDGAAEAAESGMSGTADRHGFIAVYPNGTASSRSPRSWNSGPSLPLSPFSKANDVRFTARLIDSLEEHLCLDPHRVYASGFSNGAGMVHRLGCDLSSRIAAIAPESGVYTYSTCHPTRPVSVIAFHGTADQFLTYRGDKSQGLPDIPRWAHAWARRDGCRRGPTPFLQSKMTVIYTVTAVRYTACRGSSEVELYTEHQYDHEHPLPIGRVRHPTPASEIIWRFFAAHLRR